MRAISPLLSLVVFAGFALLLVQGAQKTQANQIEGVVRYVTDGDTFQILGHEYSIRLWGIDAPERGGETGQDARTFMQDLIQGRVLTCEKKAVDKYRRTVARCYLGKRDISKLVLDAGHGVEKCSFTSNAYGSC